MSGLIGVELVGGPPPLDGWKNMYDASTVGGWPLPDEIGAIEVDGRVAIVVNLAAVPPDFESAVVRYRKVRQSNLPDNVPPTLARGAVFEAAETGNA